jgi:hypothetical protein
VEEKDQPASKSSLRYNEYQTLTQPTYKTIFTDKNDDIVVLQSSLMVGVAQKSIEKQLSDLQKDGKDMS